MALHTKIGGRESNSFVTIAEADTIICTKLPEDETLWRSLTDAEKEYRLILAASIMDFLPWRGFRNHDGQALVFPRCIPNAGPKEIPENIKTAQVQLAFSMVHRALLERSTVAEGTGGTKVSRVSLGGLLSVSFSADKAGREVAFDKFLKSVYWPIYALVLPFLLQIRATVITNDDEDPTLSTTTTTTSTTSTTTTSTTGTTTTSTTTTTTTT